jgi:spermidine/putrescine transport system substrate-binding protein
MSLAEGQVHENPYAMANPWAMPWQPKYKGKVAILDDYREGISLGLMKNGIYNLNTTDRSQIDLSRQTLQELVSLVDVQIDNNDYTEVPDGQTWIHHAWSGDMAAAAELHAQGRPGRDRRVLVPDRRQGPGGERHADRAPGSSTNPVLAHLFLNYLLDLPNALENISYNGYMQPLNAVTPQRLVKEKILPPSLMSTAVLPSYFRRGTRRAAAAGGRRRALAAGLARRSNGI